MSDPRPKPDGPPKTEEPRSKLIAHRVLAASSHPIRTPAVLAGLVLALLAGAAAAHPGIGIVLDAAGNVFYTDLRQVWRIAPDGTKSVAVPAVHTHELVLDEAGNLYGEHLWYKGEATERWGHRVWRRAPGGEVTTILGPRPGFLTDWSFVRDAAGNHYWFDRGQDLRARRVTLRRRSPDGTVVRHAPALEFANVSWLAAAPDGTLYFMEGADLRRVAPDGSAATLSRGLARRALGQFHVAERHAVMGLWTDRDGGVYAALYGARVVERVRPDGSGEEVARSPFSWGPTGGLVGPDGSLWILEYSVTNQARVRRRFSDGRERVY